MSIGRILAKPFSGPEVETRIRIETSATGALHPSSVGIRIDALRRNRNHRLEQLAASRGLVRRRLVVLLHIGLAWRQS